LQRRSLISGRNVGFKAMVLGAEWSLHMDVPALGAEADVAQGAEESAPQCRGCYKTPGFSRNMRPGKPRRLGRVSSKIGFKLEKCRQEGAGAPAEHVF
ncbi:hypothetical protein P7K49_008861, partial [Saguinus oedipus]